MAGPCIKGTGFESVVSDVNRLVAEGRISRQELEANLTPEERAQLEERILPSSWYPLATYDKLISLLLEKEGHGDDQYLVERGRRAAERLYKAGLYRQLDATVERWGERFGSLMNTLGAAMYSETEWRVERSKDAESGRRYHIEIEVPASFPECCRHTIAGFIEVLGGRAGGRPVNVRSQRVSPTRIVLETSSR
jgi:hypothetical protein